MPNSDGWTPNPNWGPQGNPWAWLQQQFDAIERQYKERKRVQVGDLCFPCSHGSCDPEDLPVKAALSVMVSGSYVVGRDTVCFYDMVPICTVCSELYQRDPEWCLWLKNQYTDWKSKGAV